MTSFVNCRQLQNFSHTVCNENRLLSGECNLCSTVVLSVHTKHLSIISETARCLSYCNRDASKTACNSNFGIVRHFMGKTISLPKTKSTSVVSVPLVTSLPRRKATAPKMSCELSPSKCNSTLSTVFLEVASRKCNFTQLFSEFQELGDSSVFVNHRPIVVRLISRCPSAGDGPSRCMEQRSR